MVHRFGISFLKPNSTRTLKARTVKTEQYISVLLVPVFIPIHRVKRQNTPILLIQKTANSINAKSAEKHTMQNLSQMTQQILFRYAVTLALLP